MMNNGRGIPRPLLFKHRPPRLATVLAFRPHPLLFNGHLQTIGGMMGPLPTEQATRRLVRLPDGDHLIIHDDQPPTWQPGQRVALLVHGLCGSHRSSYLVRIAAKLRQHGVRTCRLDMRGCGAGRGLAYHPYHSGRSDDIRQVLIAMQQWFADASLALIAFSLGANAALKLLGEDSAALPTKLDRAVVVSPPVDLAASVANLNTYPARFYDRFFTQSLLAHVDASPTLGERAAALFANQRPTRLIDFDDIFTAPLSGFTTARNYYRRCSANQFLSNVTLPTTILMAKDDPIVPWEPLSNCRLSSSTELILTDHGGHLGFVTANNHRWMDDVVVNRVIAR
jgi:uncharacterized protein